MERFHEKYDSCHNKETDVRPGENPSSVFSFGRAERLANVTETRTGEPTELMFRHPFWYYELGGWSNRPAIYYADCPISTNFWSLFTSCPWDQSPNCISRPAIRPDRIDDLKQSSIAIMRAFKRRVGNRGQDSFRLTIWPIDFVCWWLFSVDYGEDSLILLRTGNCSTW